MKNLKMSCKFLKKVKFLPVVFFLMMITSCFWSSCCLAATEPAEGSQVVSSQSEFSIGKGLGYLAAAIAISAGSIGAGKAVASSAPAALGAFSEDPSSFGKTIVFVALGEGVSILSFIVSMMIINNLAK